MTEKKNLTLLKLALTIFAVVVAVYGISQIFFTQGYMEMTGSEPVHPSWLRWPGGVLLALAYGGLRVIRNPVNQDVFIKTIAFGTLFAGLILMYTVLFEMQDQDNVWFTALPGIVNLILFVLLCLGRQQAKDVLKQV